MPSLPQPRGPLSEALIAALRSCPESVALPPAPDDDVLGDEDLQLALYVCYELHYRSFAEVDDGWEWEPSLIAACSVLEGAFMAALREAVPRRAATPDSIAETLFELAESDPAPSLSKYLEREGTLREFREFVVHRSAYQLKEADPHTWAIPRLHGPAKAAIVEIQADEYGSGRPERVHATLFARAMKALGLEGAYGAYLDSITGKTLASVNLVSLLGLHRANRGALVGHLAMFEITSPVPNRRYATALRRFGFEGDALEFYDEHVEADSVHEQIAARGLAQRLALDEPELAADILFGAEALLHLEGRFAAALLDAWRAGESSLLGEPALAGAV